MRKHPFLVAVDWKSERLPSHKSLLANQDCLGDEIIAYAEALIKTGLLAILWVHTGAPHGFTMADRPRAVRFKFRDLVDNIRNLVSPDNR